MELPFSPQQFLTVFRDYNTAIWPIQIVAYLLGLVAVRLAITSGRGASQILSIFWLWTGGVYHLIFFQPINSAALLFGIAFLFQGTLFARESLYFAWRQDVYGKVGATLIIYAMVVYPLLGFALGHGYPSSPMFGVTPCPTTTFTFGILLWTRHEIPVSILIIPALWSIVGFVAAIKLGIIEDTGLLVAAVASTGMLVVRNQRHKAPA